MKTPLLYLALILGLSLSSCDDPDLAGPAGRAGSAGPANRARLQEKLDKDGDGIIRPTARPRINKDKKTRVLQRFDADGDGKLTDDERAAARKAIQARKAQQNS